MALELGESCDCTDLFVDGVPLAKDKITTEETCNKCVATPWFSAIGLLLNQ